MDSAFDGFKEYLAKCFNISYGIRDLPVAEQEIATYKEAFSPFATIPDYFEPMRRELHLKLLEYANNNDRLQYLKIKRQEIEKIITEHLHVYNDQYSNLNPISLFKFARKVKECSDDTPSDESIFIACLSYLKFVITTMDIEVFEAVRSEILAPNEKPAKGLEHKAQIMLLYELGVFELEQIKNLTTEKKGKLFSMLLNRNEKNSTEYIRNINPDGNKNTDLNPYNIAKQVNAVKELLKEIGL